jgi:hypothetical protein
MVLSFSAEHHRLLCSYLYLFSIISNKETLNEVQLEAGSFPRLWLHVDFPHLAYLQSIPPDLPSGGQPAV